MQCWNCNASPDLPQGALSRSASCPQCHAFLRCCRMCQFYQPKAANQCLETSAQRVTRKEESNFCDYFKPNPSASTGDASNMNPAASQARQALARVFGTLDASPPPASPASPAGAFNTPPPAANNPPTQAKPIRIEQQLAAAFGQKKASNQHEP